MEFNSRNMREIGCSCQFNIGIWQQRNPISSILADNIASKEV
ncbi:hypothetical protein C7S17_1195 [Burkholderia thailandensis]|nr:hypothetical protein [Burkholderia thailandensis]